MKEINFTYAEELKKYFDVYGHFYDLKVGENTLPCRNELHIIKKDLKPNGKKPDAVVVMMNPGSSRPMDKKYIPKLLTTEELYKKKYNKDVIPTRPDNAQYQLMRVMLEKRWEYVLILNLSDLREGKSSEFAKIYKWTEDLDKNIPHSVWSENRREELYDYLGQCKTIPVIAGWGQIAVLEKMANNALGVLKEYPLFGLKYNEEGIWYRYPSPYVKDDKILWLKQILKQLN